MGQQMTLIANWKWKESGNIFDDKCKDLSILIFIFGAYPPKESSREYNLSFPSSRTLVDGFINGTSGEFPLHKFLKPTVLRDIHKLSIVWGPSKVTKGD